MILSFSGFATMIVVTLLYGGDLGWGTVLKYWAVFLILGLGSAFLFHVQFISSILQFSVAIAMFAKAKFSSAALD